MPKNPVLIFINSTPLKIYKTSATLLLQLNNKKERLTQKDRWRWLKDRDINSKFFHKIMANRRNKNGITRLEVNEIWEEKSGRISEEIKRQFQHQLQKKEVSWVNLPKELVQSKLDDGDRQCLVQPLSEEEIKAAV